MKPAKRQLKLPSGIKAGKIIGRIGVVLKKNLFVICSVLLIGGAIYLNWAFFSDGGAKTVGAAAKKGSDVKEYETFESIPDEAASDEYFTTAAVNRKRARDESMQVLQTIIDDENSENTVKNEAYEEISNIASEIEAESNIESLVISKGFEDCVAVVNGGKASVIVKSDGLLENEITQIQEIVYDQTGILPSKMKIIEKK